VSAPEAPLPDDKDWTWVVEEPCPECGFDPTFDGDQWDRRGTRSFFTVRTFAAYFLHDVEHHLHDVEG
jgi:hypothetical protein